MTIINNAIPVLLILLRLVKKLHANIKRHSLQHRNIVLHNIMLVLHSFMTVLFLKMNTMSCHISNKTMLLFLRRNSRTTENTCILMTYFGV